MADGFRNIKVELCWYCNATATDKIVINNRIVRLCNSCHDKATKRKQDRDRQYQADRFKRILYARKTYNG